MVKFLGTEGVTAELAELIKKSKERLWLVSPFIQLTDQIKVHVRNSDAKSVDISDISQRY